MAYDPIRMAEGATMTSKPDLKVRTLIEIKFLIYHGRNS